MTSQIETSKELIYHSLNLEEIDKFIYRSKKPLWKPIGNSIGVYGGEVIAQAIQAATLSCDQKYGLNSIHCYFLLAGDPTIPVVYFVNDLRLGKSYQTFSVQASQNGKKIFTLIASFALPEPTQPTFSIECPKNIPHPDYCENSEDRWQRFINKYSHKLDQSLISVIQARIVEQRNSPLVTKDATINAKFDNKGYAIDSNRHSWWIKSKISPGNKTSVQKAILAYMSDLNFINTISDTLGLRQYFDLGMMTSLDHAIWFYDDFDAGEWLLYETSCPRASNGRGNVNGRFWTLDGRLVAITTQQGLVRAKLPDSKL